MYISEVHLVFETMASFFVPKIESFEGLKS